MQKCISGKIYEHLRKSKQHSEHLRNSAGEHQRTCRKTEIRRNADLRTSTNIRENQKQNSEHLRNSASEHQRTCRKTKMPLPSSSLRHRPHNTSHLPISSSRSLYIVSAIESLADFGRSNNSSLVPVDCFLFRSHFDSGLCLLDRLFEAKTMGSPSTCPIYA